MSVTNAAVSSQVTAPEPSGPCDDDDCGIRDVLDRLGDRWTVLVIVELSKGVRRFSALHRAIPGISQRMLTPTPTGRSLADTVFGLADWSREHKTAIATARDHWDAEHAADKPSIR